jgi:O-antigen/teichoic acid export membrane protein
MLSSTSARRIALEQIRSLRAVIDAGAMGLAGASVAAIAGQLALTKLISTTISVADFGVFQMVLSVAWLLQSCAFGPLAVAAMRLASEASEHGWLRPLLRSVFVLSVPVALVAFVVADFPRLTSLLVSGEVPQWLGFGGVAYGCLMGICSVLVAAQQGLLLNRAAAIVLVAQSWVPIAVLAAGYRAGFSSVAATVALICVALGAVAALQVAMLVGHMQRRRGEGTASRTPARTPFREALAIVAPAVAWAPCSYVTDFADRWALARFATLADVGAYGVLVILTLRAITAISYILDRVFAPQIFALAGNGEDPERLKRASHLLALSCVVLGALCLPLLATYYFAPHSLIALVSSADYESGAADLWLLGIAAVIFDFARRLTFFGYMLKRPWIYLPSKIVPALALVALLWLWTPTHGIHGVALSLIAANSLQFVMAAAANLWLSRYLRGTRIQRRRSLAA